MIGKPKQKGILHFQNGGYLFVASGTRISLSQRYICFSISKNTGIFSAAREEAVCFHAVFLSPAFLLRQLDEFKKALKPGISAAHLVCRSALSVRSSSAHDLPGRFAPDTPLQTASVYVKIVLDTQNCILFCVFEIFIWDFCSKSIFDVCWTLPSLPLRGAWIEISRWCRCTAALAVAPLAGSVDRNFCPCDISGCRKVAPLAGSVDRNTSKVWLVAQGPWSLPLRGAWIEILHEEGLHALYQVAPLAGSVDRNGLYWRWLSLAVLSLPSRGAWIEIPQTITTPAQQHVATLPGSVDRNYCT